MKAIPIRVIQYGQDEPLPDQEALRAGPLTLLFEEGDLRYIRLGDREVLRRIYVAVRDQKWGTVPGRISNLRINRDQEAFDITFDCEHRQGDIDFWWRGTVHGDKQGTITFTTDGQARSTFLRNRIGLCVLHPIKECAGAPFRATKVDGSVERGAFPEEIAPHQLVKDVRALTHEVSPGLKVEVRFSGDVFEMEDQRNWTDGSYKTYSTPLELPCPVDVKQGTKIWQSVSLTLRGEAHALGVEPQMLTLRVASAPGAELPRIGLSAASHDEPLTEREISRLNALNLSHLRVDLWLSRPEWPSALDRAASEAAALRIPLEIALYLSDDAEKQLRAVRDACERLGPSVVSWLVFQIAERSTTARWVELTRNHLADYDAAAKIGAGTAWSFAELNRNRPPTQFLDLVCYAMNPQMHAFDKASLVEALEGQAWTVRSGRRFVQGLPLAISPITLKPRHRPGTGASQGQDELPQSVDVRQMSLFGAAWTLGSLGSIAQKGVYSVTYYETTGWRGVMEAQAGSPLPDRFPSVPGMVFPVYHVLADVGEFAGGQIIPVTSDDPLLLTGLALRKNGKVRVIVANLSRHLHEVKVENLGPRVRVRPLNAINAYDAMLRPETFRAQAGDELETSDGELQVQVPAFGILRIDSSNDDVM